MPGPKTVGSMVAGIAILLMLLAFLSMPLLHFAIHKGVIKV